MQRRLFLASLGYALTRPVWANAPTARHTHTPACMAHHASFDCLPVPRAWQTDPIKYPLTITDSIGQTHRFDRAPKRVAALNWDLVENVIALGVAPVASCEIEAYQTWVREPAMPAGVIDVGSRTAPNVGLIESSKPDVIFITGSQRALIPALTKIAPTVCLENTLATGLNEALEAWRQFAMMGAILSRPEAVTALHTQLTLRLDFYRQKIAVAFDHQPIQIQVIRFSTPTTVFVYGPNSIADFVVRALGASQPYVMEPTAYGLQSVRIRALGNLENAYVIYVGHVPFEHKVLNSILWTATPFARKGRVQYGDNYWSHGGAYSILQTVETIGQAILKMAPGARQKSLVENI